MHSPQNLLIPFFIGFIKFISFKIALRWRKMRHLFFNYCVFIVIKLTFKQRFSLQSLFFSNRYSIPFDFEFVPKRYVVFVISFKDILILSE